MKVAIPLPFGHKKNKFSLPHQMVTTSDFGKICPICVTEMVPGDDFNVTSQSFCRLAPMPVPTFADVTLETCAFYVPMRQLWYDGREFFANQTYFSPNSKKIEPSAVPCACNSMFAFMFTDGRYSMVTEEATHDFSMTVGSGTKYYKFTKNGRAIYDLLCSLGYQITFKWNDDTRMSLLPLLAFVHIVHEYYLPQIAYPDPNVQKILSLDSYYYTNCCTQWESSAVGIRSLAASHAYNTIYTIINDLNFPLRSYLKNDYFTSAWKYPNGNPSNYSGTDSDANLNVNVPNGPNSSQKVYSNLSAGTPPVLGDNNNALTNVGLNLLRAVTNYVTRNAVAGNKMVDRFFARFGIKLPDLTLQRPVYLGKSVQQINISDVTATSTVPSGSVLGDYAGKGTSYGNGKFSCSADEFGYFMIIQTIQPHTGIATGRKRHTVHLKYDEFYAPEFDCIGTQAIRKDEVFCRMFDEATANSLFEAGYAPNGVFGYCPRYSEYKFGAFTLSGDFVLGSRYDNMSSYHLFRDGFVGNPSIDRAFLSAGNTIYNEFNRIFNYTGNDYDHFFLVHQTNIIAYRNMHQVGDTLDLEDVHGNGRSVEVDYGGKHQ